MKHDTIYQAAHKQLVNFQFDKHVVDVFPDMIRRSVPGYETVISLLGNLASQYTQDDSNIYDLGCSLGASTLSIANQVDSQKVTYMAIDNSPEMAKQCQENLAKVLKKPFKVHCEDIIDTTISNASVIVLNFTLQFFPPEKRQQLLTKLYHGLNHHGCLILSEKISFDNPEQQARMTQWHHHFKRANHYSDLEISQKRKALDNVLIPDSIDVHHQRLKHCGFASIDTWFQCHNFASFIALKDENKQL
ncbi:MAG TPA: carboxy-S-adenosyl-L-methionine synthase CmoA [Thiotrichaceae bacterium]|nr:carboxy-S-adenosyl-L-methionine synthase CmoA [Thiotrichaceae bacterium]